MFRHYISINALRNQYRNLYGLTVGGNIHSEPIHIAIKRLEEEMLAKANWSIFLLGQGFAVVEGLEIAACL